MNYENIGPVNNKKYKISMCKKWTETGSCSYNEKCQFAHGPQELELWRSKKSKIFNVIYNYICGFLFIFLQYFRLENISAPFFKIWVYIMYPIFGFLRKNKYINRKFKYYIFIYKIYLTAASFGWFAYVNKCEFIITKDLVIELFKLLISCIISCQMNSISSNSVFISELKNGLIAAWRYKL